jgi:hypothetical protein
MKRELEEDFPYLSSIGPNIKHSKVILMTMEELRDENNPFDISFQPFTVEQARDFNQLLIQELTYRALPVNGTLRDKRELLKSALEAEQKYDLVVKLTLSTDLESAFIAIETAIRCILHGGNRLGEKIFYDAAYRGVERMLHKKRAR